MQNNETLRRIAAALPLSDEDMVRLVDLAGLTERLPAPAGLLLDPDTAGHVPCDDASLLTLLDALIVLRRGSSGGKPPVLSAATNNVVLKKLRIALDLRDQDMLDLFERAGVHMRRSQLGALFRAETNKHFQACSDGHLLCFLTALGRRQEA